jgi:hypothetical protein
MAVVVAVLVALLLARGDGDGGVAGLVAGVPGAVEDAGRAHLTMAVRLDDPDQTSADGEGAVDFDSGAGWFDVTVLGQRISMRTDGATLYLLPAGETTWLAAKADDAGAVGAFGTGPSEVVAFVDLLRGDVGDVQDKGTDEVGGVDARHVRLRIDLDRAVAAAPERSRSALQSLATLAPDGRLPMDLWIDDRGRPVRQRIRGTLRGVDVVVTVDLSGWGHELGVPIPPEGAVRDVDAAELAQIFGRRAG